MTWERTSTEPLKQIERSCLAEWISLKSIQQTVHHWTISLWYISSLTKGFRIQILFTACYNVHPEVQIRAGLNQISFDLRCTFSLSPAPNKNSQTSLYLDIGIFLHFCITSPTPCCRSLILSPRNHKCWPVQGGFKHYMTHLAHDMFLPIDNQATLVQTFFEQGLYLWNRVVWTVVLPSCSILDAYRFLKP